MAHIRIIEAKGRCEGVGQEMKIEVSHGDINLRGLIRDCWPTARKLQDVREDESRSSRAGSMLNESRKALHCMARKLTGNDKIPRQEQAGLAFSAMVGIENAEALCNEIGADRAFMSAEPKNYGDARKRDDFQKWRTAECIEIKNSFDKGTFLICDEADVPDGVKVTSFGFSYKAQTGASGMEVRCEARLNCDGRFQCENTYSDTFAPTSRFSTLRAICALAVQENMKLYQFDVKSAFLIPECKEDIFIQLPGEYRLPVGKVLKLKKMLYGLKNSAAAWSDHINSCMVAHGYKNVDGDGVTFVKSKNHSNGRSSGTIIGLHVDDGNVCTNDDSMYEQLISELTEDYELRSYGKLELYEYLWPGA